MRPQLVQGDRGPGAQLHHGRDLLPQHRVRYAQHGGVGDLRVVVQDPLHLDAVHVLAAADDHVLEPVDDADPPLTHGREIAGPEPAVLERGGGGGRIVPVAAYQRLPAQPQLTDLALGQRLTDGSGDPHLGRGRRPPHAARVLPVAGTEVGEHATAGLGEPVAVARLDPLSVTRRQPRHEIGRCGGPAGAEMRQRLQLRPGPLGRVEQLEGSGRHARVVRDAVPLDELEGLLGVPLPHQYERPADRHHRVQRGERGHMEERERLQDDGRGPLSRHHSAREREAAAWNRGLIAAPTCASCVATAPLGRPVVPEV